MSLVGALRESGGSHKLSQESELAGEEAYLRAFDDNFRQQKPSSLLLRASSLSIDLHPSSGTRGAIGSNSEGGHYGGLQDMDLIAAVVQTTGIRVQPQQPLEQVAICG